MSDQIFKKSRKNSEPIRNENPIKHHPTTYPTKRATLTHDYLETEP